MPTRVINYSEDDTDDEQQAWNKVITFFYSFTLIPQRLRAP